MRCAPPEDGQERRQPVGARRGSESPAEHVGALELLLAWLPERGARIDELGIESLIGVDGPGEVPGVDEVIGEQLQNLTVAGARTTGLHVSGDAVGVVGVHVRAGPLSRDGIVLAGVTGAGLTDVVVSGMTRAAVQIRDCPSQRGSNTKPTSLHQTQGGSLR